MIRSTRNTASRWVLSAGMLAGFVGLTACNPRPETPQQEDQHIQQQAAKTTEQVKAGAKVAAADAKVATENASRKLKDIAVGVRQGLHNGSADDTGTSDSKPTAGRIDLNSASQDELAALPGISAGKAQQIIDARPYGSSHDLVSKGVLSEARYERIARRVTAR